MRNRDYRSESDCMRRHILIFLCLPAFLCAKSIVAQHVEWSVDFSTIFDNREGDNKITDTRTFFQTQLSPEVGLSLLDGQHRLMGGIVWTQPIGCEWEGHRLSPTLYYRYAGSRGWSFTMGMFPRTLMYKNMPDYIWNDSIYYAQRNIRGAMVTYAGDNGYFEAVVDWRAMQSDTRREAFNIITRGEYQRPTSGFLIGAVAMMNHFALTHPARPDDHIVDNFIVNPYVGIDISRSTGLDSLVFRLGALSSITRNRAESKWKVPVGAWLDVNLEWRWFRWHNVTYIGGRLFPYYQEFGALLDLGEPYYQSKWYNRTSLQGTIIDNQYVNLRASLDFNIAPDNFTFYQRLILRVYIDSSFRNLKKGYKLPPSVP